MKEQAKTGKQQPRKSRGVLWTIVIAAGVLITGGIAAAWIGIGGEAEDYGPVSEVDRGDLTISVTESGSLRSRDQVVVSNRIEGRTTLIWIIEEGTQVEEGDLLAEFDSSELENELADARIEVQNAEADFIRAREQLEVTKSQNESDIAAAELTLRLAKLDLARYVGEQEMIAESEALSSGITLAAEADAGETEGEYAQQREQLLSEIDLAREELTRMQQQYEDSRDLADEGFITELEVEGDRLAMERGRVELKLAQGELRLLENYTHKRDSEQLQSDVEQGKRALERVKLTANSNLVQAQADFDSADQEFEEEKRELAEVKQQIAYCEVRAPAAGMVVYETSTNQRRWGNDEPLEAGQEIRERQELIYLPSSKGMIADITVHESALDRISLGMPARVTVDAQQGNSFEGEVRRIAPMPDAQSIWLNPDLTVYSTEIGIDAGSENLRTGMSCRVEIIVEELEDVIFAPLQSVVRYGDRHYVYVVPEQGPPVATQVEIGNDNNRVVHIVSGVEPGQQVLLAPPLHDRMDPEAETEPADAPPPEAQPIDEPAPQEEIADQGHSQQPRSEAGESNTQADEEE